MANYAEADIPTQSGKTFLVTGANTGIGWDTARVLAERVGFPAVAAPVHAHVARCVLVGAGAGRWRRPVRGGYRALAVFRGPPGPAVAVEGALDFVARRRGRRVIVDQVHVVASLRAASAGRRL